MFDGLTGIAAANLALVGILRLAVDGRHGDDQPSATRPKFEQG
ncbi:hypothetical protein [Methylobacterium aquaticum]|nr:hypothetical protein [Methylobacterium aquaticum]